MELFLHKKAELHIYTLEMVFGKKIKKNKVSSIFLDETVSREFGEEITIRCAFLSEEGNLYVLEGQNMKGALSH